MSSITTDKVIKISHAVASAILSLHCFDSVHRDTNVQNILMDENNEDYLTDSDTW